MCQLVASTHGDCRHGDDNDDYAPFLESNRQPEVAVVTGVKDFLVLTYTQVAGLCLAAFAMGGLMPFICSSEYKMPQNPSQNDIGSALFNNLKQSSPATRTAGESQSPKIAWRKSANQNNCLLNSHVLCKILPLFISHESFSCAR